MGTADAHPEVEAVAAEIASMEIRGAAAIAEAAANALRVQAEESDATGSAAFRADQRTAARRLLETRPTAVSLPNALRFVMTRTTGETVDELRHATVEAAREFADRLADARADLGRIGANRLRDGDTVVTHCHSSDAMACVDAALDQGKSLSAVVKETRPRLQGHVTARQLADRGVDVTVIVDGAARRFLDDADHVLVGADSVAADGSIVNKIGTSGLAVVARERDVPVTVAAQTLKLHPGTLRGESVDIEERDPGEVLSAEERAAIGDVDVANPAFDVTPPRYLDAIVTERGQFPPESVVVLMRELFGESPVEPWNE